MKTLLSTFSLALLTLVFTSCANPSGKLTHDDSARIAREYFKANPRENKVRVKTYGNDRANRRYDRANAERFQQQWKSNAMVLTENDEPLAGFSFRGADYRTLVTDPRVEGLYVSFVQKDDGEISLMLQGVNSGNMLVDSLGSGSTPRANTIARGDGTLFFALDDAPSCPKACPK